jgi:hypothetical protein
MKTTLELPDQTVLELPYNPRNNLPLMLPDNAFSAGIGLADLTSFAARSSLLSVTDQTNQNLRPAQKELLLWHFKLGHAGFQWCQKRCRASSDPFREQILVPNHSSVTSCDAPLCTACQLSKQTRRSPEVKTQINPAPMIQKDNLKPGDCISVDQYMSPLPGRLPQNKARSPKRISILVAHSLLIMHLVLFSYAILFPSQPVKLFVARKHSNSLLLLLVFL